MLFSSGGLLLCGGRFLLGSRGLLFGCCGLLLGGCGYSVEQLTEDTEKRRAILAECAEMRFAAKDEEKSGDA